MCYVIFSELRKMIFFPEKMRVKGYKRMETIDRDRFRFTFTADRQKREKEDFYQKTVLRIEIVRHVHTQFKIFEFS